MPWPKEEPTGANPPDGAIINYYLKDAQAGPVTLEIQDAGGRLVRRHSSTDPVTAIPDPKEAPVPTYWYRPPQPLSTVPGMHRFTWDVHYQPLGGAAAGGRGGLPIQGIPYNSPAAATTPWVTPGTYTVTLTAGGKRYSQPITVKQDPRVKTPAAVMQQVYALTEAMYFGAAEAQEAAAAIESLRGQAAKIQAQGAAAQALAAFVQKASALEGQRPAAGGGGRGGAGGGAAGGAAAGGRAGSAGPSPAETLWAASALLAGQMNTMQAADVAPTAITLEGVNAALRAAEVVLARWGSLKDTDLPALNATLKAAGLPVIGGGNEN
ncbi:MAG: hypothetical protein EHM24_03890 [Acidobacteria bacterium]|nr:MAG: hypothetical protein EHM24_03890 [Acidobacteriota bacterium]